MKSHTYLKKTSEAPYRTFKDVDWILQSNWMDTVKESLLTVLTTPWNFGANINEEDLDGYIEVGDFLFHQENNDLDEESENDWFLVHLVFNKNTILYFMIYFFILS